MIMTHSVLSMNVVDEFVQQNMCALHLCVSAHVIRIVNIILGHIARPYGPLYLVGI